MIIAPLRIVPKLSLGNSHIAMKEAIGARAKKIAMDMFTNVVEFIP